MTAEEVHTKSALADKVKEFLTQYKDPLALFLMLNKLIRW